MACRSEMPGQDCQDTAASIGLPEQDCQYRNARQDRTAKTGLPEHNFRDRTVRAVFATCMKLFEFFFLTVRIFHDSKLARFLLYIALNIGNSDQLQFLSYLAWFLSYKPL